MRKTEAQARERMGLCRGSDAHLSFWDICFWADQTQPSEALPLPGESTAARLRGDLVILLRSRLQDLGREQGSVQRRASKS
jgi:hypothetical protein